MSKAMFGFAAALALAASPAWAGDERSGEKVSSDAIVTAEHEGEARSERIDESAPGSFKEARAHLPMVESKEVRASFEERWLLEREGYRDGGY